MKAQALLYCFSILTLFPCGSHDLLFPAFFSQPISNNEQLILGRYDEEVILPCSFKHGSEVVIHWKNGNYNVHHYYYGKDQLEAQDLRYANRTSLFHNEIHNGNASLTIRRLTLLDEGIYICYVGTTSESVTNKVVLKVGAFHTPVMKYEKKKTGSFLECSILSIYPYSQITWKKDNANVSGSSSEETEATGPFYIKSTLNITGSYSSFECAIENSLLNQTWKGKWTLADNRSVNQRESISLWCRDSNNFLPPNQDFHVTWSKVENGAYSVLSSEVFTGPSDHHSWNKTVTDHNAFRRTFSDLRVSDSGEYLCNVSSTEYTLLTVHRLHVAPSQRRASLTIVCAVVGPAILVLAVIIILNCKLRRDSDDSEGTRRNEHCDGKDQSIQTSLSNDGANHGSDDVIDPNSEMCLVSTDQRVSNHDDSTDDGVKHCFLYRTILNPKECRRKEGRKAGRKEGKQEERKEGTKRETDVEMKSIISSLRM